MSTNTIVNNKNVNEFLTKIQSRNPNQPKFLQAVSEVAKYVLPYCEENPIYEKHKIFERMIEPDRVVIFRVCWENDKGEVEVNKGYRVQFNNSIGPYKGGLRFHPTVDLDTFKFLGFEQVFKNSLTTLPMGAGKGGSDFDPKGKSDNEVMRFCQSFMTELARHIGENLDIPAGDIGVGAREISYLYGQYKRIANQFVGVLTGKSLEYGGSLIRREATGYGCVFFVDEMLRHANQEISGKTAVVSGSGNVAQYTAQKLIQLGAKVVTFSDSGGFIYDKDGINQEKLDWIIDLKTNRRGRISEYAEKFGCDYHAGQRPWNVKCDLAFPSATENELTLDDAKQLVANGCIAVGEGANMPSTLEAVDYFVDNKVLLV